MELDVEERISRVPLMSSIFQRRLCTMVWHSALSLPSPSGIWNTGRSEVCVKMRISHHSHRARENGRQRSLVVQEQRTETPSAVLLDFTARLAVVEGFWWDRACQTSILVSLKSVTKPCKLSPDVALP
jgi:hypothetical protein